MNYLAIRKFNADMVVALGLGAHSVTRITLSAGVGKLPTVTATMHIKNAETLGLVMKVLKKYSVTLIEKGPK